ncbi:type ISP restriction/modification enzyme [Algoriphagus sp. C2-6-M1]|uniref:type ISP restriction/modification enzyme n=1 Tax=Algoriphagus persicinus TaxID=3108754 RepID=UPI002B3C1B58|nr:type ISP restriction/modification enzyme [Algoriphagus sp. C2-6-M1]MEB2780410.1 type ISP restriction/modification enzyme [Algoriphagus sp. C2-6-M1]
MTVSEYLQSINTRYKLGHATEHTFRGDLQNLIESLVPNISATNEPKRQACGAPDYILTNKKEIPVGYIEAKDIGDTDLQGLKKNGNKEQFDRYKASLDNLIFTDYLSFYYYKNGELVTSICIGVVDHGKVLPLPHNFPAFELLITEFTTHIGQSIKSPKKLAEMMAGKARLLANVIQAALESDEINQDNSTLQEQMFAFKEILIHDITPKQFSDVYAQTIAYGMFAARLYDTSLDTFSRQEAAELIPKSNPFLRKLFQYIAGYDLDARITWIVDALADIFRAADVQAILKNFGKATKMEDPIIHFYEDFLTQYDPKLRKQRGVWYTPHPVVNFIIRAVDEILQTEFGLPMGLADTSKTKIKIPIPTHDKRFAGGMREVEQEVHRVQFLDPATGTGTFVAEAISQIYDKMKGQQGLWNSYVENHLLPRINGFELLMASYAMAHLKLDLLLKQTGYTGTKNQRFRIYLTNSLEEYHKDTGTLFANWLSAEASEANQIKRDAPVMIVAGNPPYSVSSTNKGEWIQNMIADYKKNLNERKINLDDDYIKFIRYGQHYIDKNGSGILAYISNNSFIDGITHRQMRKSLLKTFDKIYIIDLHGSAKKNEKALDGGKDENVFDIQQGVSINIFIKKFQSSKNDLASVHHLDVYGDRELKYNLLATSEIKNLDFSKVEYTNPYYFFVPKNFEFAEVYESGFRVDDLLKIYSNGIETKCDSLSIKFKEEDLTRVINNFATLSVNELKLLYNNRKESSGWNFLSAKETFVNDKIHRLKINYRPFDLRYSFLTESSGGFIGRSRFEVMKNFLQPNIGIQICKQQSTFDFQHVLVSSNVVDRNSISIQTKESTYFFPLYLYPESSGQLSLGSAETRTPNLNMEIVDQIAKGLGLTFVPEKRDGFVPRHDETGEFAPIDLLDYIYAVLHSPTYRETYKEFLKIDFPRVLYPSDADTFWKLVALGGELRQLHLMESPTLSQFITQYPAAGENEVEKPRFAIAPARSGGSDESASSRGRNDRSDLTDETASPPRRLAVTGRVYINAEQYFDSVPEVAWNFYIGGYQPAQKWLKDRKGRVLDFEDIMHYQRIIKALTETDRVMGEIDGVGVMEGGEG